MHVLIFDSQADFYAERLSESVPELQYCPVTTEEQAVVAAADARVLVCLAPHISPRLLGAMPHVEWIQALTTGIDNLKGLTGIALTNCHGIHGPQMSELCLLLMLATLRRFPHMLENQSRHVWERWPQPLLAGRSACIVGLGAIAEHLAGVLGVFGMRVTGVSDSRAAAPGIEQVYTRQELSVAASLADFLIVLTPYTAQTHHLIDSAIIDAMPDSAHLINLSRGGCVDEKALAIALEEKRIAGAALDVFANSPLQASDSTWDLPNLIVTPHIGGFSDVYHEQALPILVANMRAYAQGGVEALTQRLDT